MPVATLAFGSYRPDLPPLSDGVVSVAENVVPGSQGWQPMPSFAQILSSAALPDRPLGGFASRASDAETSIFAGTSDTIYQFAATSWDDVGTGYGASDTGWSFVQYGNRVIAANGSDPLQKFDLSTDTAFSDLDGTPPVLAFLTVVKNFVVGGRVDTNAQAIAWSGNNNSEIWTPGVGESDFQVFADGGPVNAIAGGEFGLILQENCIRRMDYVGGNIIFDISVISPNVGCVAPRSFVQVGQRCFFWSYRGFMTCDGAAVEPIGDQRVDDTFARLASSVDFAQMSAVADPIRKIILWTVPAAEPDLCFGYNWALGEWFTLRQSARLLFSALRPTYTLEDLDDIAPPDLDDAGISVDEPGLQGGVPLYYVFDGNNRLGSMAGPNMAWSLEIPLIQPMPDRSVRVRRARPLTDAIDGLSFRIDARARLGDAQAFTATGSMMADGTMPLLVSGRFMAARLSAQAGTDCTFVKGVRVEYEPQGRGL